MKQLRSRPTSAETGQPVRALAVRAGARAACLLLLATAGAAGAAGQHLPPIAPDWSWRPGDDVEWVEAVGPASPAALLVATSSGRLYVLDPLSGAALAPRPVAAAPGARPAARESDDGATGAGRSPPPATMTASAAPAPATPAPAAGAATAAASAAADSTASADHGAYVFDRFRVYAITVAPAARLRWQVHFWQGKEAVPAHGGARPTPDIPGDPEHVPRILAAQATRWGVLVASDDGRLALLDRDDGGERWRQALPPTATVWLKTLGPTAAVCWKAADRFHVRWLDLPSGASCGEASESLAGVPTLVALTPAGLVLANPSAVVVLPAGAPARRHPLLDRDTAVARPLAILAGGTPDGGPRDATGLLHVGGDGRLRLLDLGAMRVAWDVAEEPHGTPDWAWLRVADGQALYAVSHTLNVRDLATGERLSRAVGDPVDRLLDAWPAGKRVWILWRIGGGQEQRLRVDRLDLPDHAATMTAAAPAGPPPPAHTFGPLLDLAPDERFLSAVWTDERIIIATRRGLHGYTLR